MKLDESLNLEDIARETHGYVGVDLLHLCTESAMICIRESLKNIDIEASEIPVEVLNGMRITHAHFGQYMQNNSPSALRETVVEMPNVKWEDVIRRFGKCETRTD